MSVKVDCWEHLGCSFGSDYSANFVKAYAVADIAAVETGCNEKVEEQ